MAAVEEEQEVDEGDYEEDDEEYYSDAGGDDDKADGGGSESSGSSRGPPRLQLDPLQIRFSQKKMRNVFGDGKKVEEAVSSVQTVRRSKEEEELYDAAWKLEAPFPPIEVLRWRCKLRDEKTGRPLLNERGKEMFEAEESWFTLDNRRLYCLQKAALKLLREEGPQAHCTATVIAEVRKDRRMREIRKFRTMDNGQSVMVGSIVDGVPFQRWDWRLEYKDPNRTDADRHVPFKQRTGKGKKGKGKGKDQDGENAKGGKGKEGGGGKGHKGKVGAPEGSAPAVGAPTSGAAYPPGVMPDVGCKGGMDFSQFAAAFQTAGGKAGKDGKDGGGKAAGKGKQAQQHQQHQQTAYSYSQEWDKYPSYSDYYGGYYAGGVDYHGGGGGGGNYYGGGAYEATGKGSKGGGKSTKGKIGGGGGGGGGKGKASQTIGAPSYKGSNNYYAGAGYGYGYGSNYYY